MSGFDGLDVDGTFGRLLGLGGVVLQRDRHTDRREGDGCDREENSGDEAEEDLEHDVSNL